MGAFLFQCVLLKHIFLYAVFGYNEAGLKYKRIPNTGAALQRHEILNLCREIFNFLNPVTNRWN